jgi:chromosome segregation ATPase
MEAQEQQIKSIADKLQQVLQRYQALQRENEQLVKDMRVLKERGSAQQQKIDELELKMAALKTATGQLDETEKKDVDKRLNLYIREIDRCIAMLSE